jgi:DNA-binding response OmpR family regulator
VPTVLIVEDNLALADALAEVSRSIGYSALVAHDGDAALSGWSVSGRRSSSSISNCRRSTG